MTCIVGLVDGGRVWIGGDSAGVGGYDLVLRADSKVFENGPFLMGFTTSFRMGQLLRFSLSVPPRHADTPAEQYMVTTFVDAVRACLKAGGFATNEKGGEVGGQFLVGYEGAIYLIDDDYQVGIPLDGYAAVGCGANLALGALHATKGQEAETRVRLALEAAEHHSAGVRAPFVTLAIPPIPKAEAGS